MTRWETALTTRDTNRIVRPLEWGFDWLEDFSDEREELSVVGSQLSVEGYGAARRGRPGIVGRRAGDEAAKARAARTPMVSIG